jgi:nucleoid-associated protein YgaU
MMPEPDRPPTARTHRIADGDSLVTLAERYLGSPDRALEIFEANRDVLSHPQLLPIGTELKIPPQNRPAGQP